MMTDSLITIVLSSGFNEVDLPKKARLHHVDVNGYDVNLFFKAGEETGTEYRQFYVAFNNTPTDYDQGMLHLLKAIEFADGTSLAMIYEVYPYESQ